MVKSTPRKKAGQLPGYLRAKECEFDADTPLSKLEDAKRSRARRNQAPSLDAKIHKIAMKCIRDNFPNFSDAEIHKVKHDGHTLWEVIYADKLKAHNNDKDAPKFGRRFFERLRRLYGRSSAADTMEPSEEEAVADELFDAVDQSRAKPPKRERLMLFCKTTAHKVNKTEAIGLIQHAFELNPNNSNYSLNVEIASYLVRVGTPSRFPKEWSIFSRHLDSVLCFGYAHLRSKGWALQTFCDGHRTLIETVLPYDSVQRLLAVKGSWDDVEDDIEAVTNYTNSTLGEKMFSFARIAMSTAKVSKVVQEEIENGLQGTASVTMQMVSEVRERATAKLKEFCRWEDLDRPRVIAVPYLGDIPVKVEVPSAWAELNLRLDTKLKLVAFNSHMPDDERKDPLLPPLFCEFLLCPRPTDPKERLVAAELLTKFKSCRVSANSQVVRGWVVVGVCPVPWLAVRPGCCAGSSDGPSNAWLVWRQGVCFVFFPPFPLGRLAPLWALLGFPCVRVRVEHSGAGSVRDGGRRQASALGEAHPPPIGGGGEAWVRRAHHGVFQHHWRDLADDRPFRVGGGCVLRMVVQARGESQVARRVDEDAAGGMQDLGYLRHLGFRREVEAACMLPVREQRGEERGQHRYRVDSGAFRGLLSGVRGRQ